MHGIFITGTDTGVGKTFLAAGIATALRERGINVGVMKPIHTGCKMRNGKLIPADSFLLARAACIDDSVELITPYVFREPVAPYVAAIENNVIINIDRIIKSFKALCRLHDYVIVEGIGGVLVPINRNFYVSDLIKELGIPAIIVTRPGLGTINHTMLTINYLKERKIPLMGIIINYNRKEKAALAERKCPEILKKLSGIPLLGIIPYRSKEGPAGLNPFLKLSDRLFNIGNIGGG